MLVPCNTITSYYKRVSIPVVYSIREGDTLWDTARRNRMTIEQITRRNPQIKNPDMIHPRDQILLDEYLTEEYLGTHIDAIGGICPITEVSNPGGWVERSVILTDPKEIAEIRRKVIDSQQN